MGKKKNKPKSQKRVQSSKQIEQINKPSKENPQNDEQRSLRQGKIIHRLKLTISLLERYKIGYIIALAVGLIPYLFSLTPVSDIIHPISIQPSSIKAEKYTLNGQTLNVTKQFVVTNNRNKTLFGVTVIADLPEGLRTKDVCITRMTPLEDMNIPAYFTMVGGHSNLSGRDYFQLNIPRILPGDSNIIAYSINVTGSQTTEPIKLYCVHYSKEDIGIFSGNGTMIQADTPMYVPK